MFKLRSLTTFINNLIQLSYNHIILFDNIVISLFFLCGRLLCLCPYLLPLPGHP